MCHHKAARATMICNPQSMECSTTMCGKEQITYSVDPQLLKKARHFKESKKSSTAYLSPDRNLFIG